MGCHVGTLREHRNQYRWRTMQRVLLILRPALAAALVALAVLGVASHAAAHTDIDYTLPADGEQATAPVAEITVAFTDAVTLVGTGFEVLTPAGAVVQPSVFSEDGVVYFLEVTEPLAGGVAAVRYQVAAADGHVIEGGFRFTVPGAAAATAPPAPAPPATASPATSASATAAPATTGGVPSTSAAAPPVTSAPALSAPAPGTAVLADDDDGADGGAILVGVLPAVAVAGVAFLLVRSRTSSSG
jgi:copper resistance protein C